jgi:hypothetical protein
VDTTEIPKLNNKGGKNPWTLKPVTKCDTKYTRITLITNKNNPKLRIVIGKLIILRTGLRRYLQNPSLEPPSRI